MSRSIFFYTIASLCLAILPQCADQSVSVVKARSGSFYKGGQSITAPSPPSSSLVALSKNQTRDRHGFPVYSFSERNRLVRTTAYTCTEDDHLKYGSKNAIGTDLKYSSRVRSAAADWSFYPLGTVFKINGHSQLYVIDDYGSALAGAGTIDIYHPSKDMMNLWGRRNVEITVLKWGSFEQSASILSKRKDFSHCRQMYANIQRMIGVATKTAAR